MADRLLTLATELLSPSRQFVDDMHASVDRPERKSPSRVRLRHARFDTQMLAEGAQATQAH